ncbi:MAG: SLBB domain-containing protein [Bacteroidetes bacterium]|nr:SLBB domain-containing protein [Bacteroidota bacterium]
MYKLIAFLALGFIFLVSPTISNGQPITRPSLSAVPDDTQSQLRDVMISQIAQSGILALEGSINPAEYIIGPGDLFSLMIGGVVPAEIPITISVSGLLILPEIGAIKAGGRTLADVQLEASKLLELRYANTPVSLSLIRARSFYVHVTGSVFNTGRYLMLPRSRVSDVIHQALSSPLISTHETKDDLKVDFAIPESSFRLEINDSYKPALRNIHIQHIDGSEDLIDLIRYQTTGKIEYNPVLKDGDLINIPAFHVVREAIRVSGDVSWPGLYDWRSDDTVKNILDLANGGRELDQSLRLRLLRWTDDTHSTLFDHQISDVSKDSIASIELLPGDHISVFEGENAVASVEGWVFYPGEYQIEGGVTTLSELIELAGGLKSGANIDAALLERTSVDNLADPPEIPAQPFQENPGLGKQLTIEFTEVFQRPFSGEIGTHVSVDIVAALNGSGEEIVLYHGDRLIIPRDERTILVTGHVAKPGYVTFVPGQPAKYYVERAGGAGPVAEGIYVYGGSSSLVRQGPNEIVLPSDAVFVGWLEDLTVRNRQIRTQRNQIILSAISVLTGLTATIIAVFR